MYARMYCSVANQHCWRYAFQFASVTQCANGSYFFAIPISWGMRKVLSFVGAHLAALSTDTIMKPFSSEAEDVGKFDVGVCNWPGEQFLRRKRK